MIDYRTIRFEEVLRDVDVVLDTIGGDTMDRSWRVLRRGGTLVSVAAPPPPEPARDTGARGIFFIVEPSRSQLVEIARLIDAGQIRPVLDAVLPLARRMRHSSGGWPDTSGGRSSSGSTIPRRSPEGLGGAFDLVD